MDSLKDVGRESKPAVRININGTPRGVSDSSSGLEGSSGSNPHTPGVRININGTPRGVSNSTSGLEGSNG